MLAAVSVHAFLHRCVHGLDAGLVWQARTVQRLVSAGVAAVGYSNAVLHASWAALQQWLLVAC